MSTHLLAAAVDLKTNFFTGHGTAGTNFSSLGQVVSIFLPNVIVFAGILFFFLILYSGFQLINLGGQYNLDSQKVTRAKQMVYYSIIGFLLVVSAYFILQIVSTVTGINFINSPVT
jgi:hypothetical protein